MSEGRPWKVSIVGHADVDPRTLQAHPLNPRLHTREQDAVVEASLRDLGWVKSVIVNQTTGRLLDGHERVELALLRGEATVPVEYVAIAEADEGKALLTLDASSALARTHVERWAALTREARTEEPALQGLWAQVVAQDKGTRQPDTSEVPGSTAGVEHAQAQADRGAQVQATWQTALGQVWQCGAHIVVCGDSTSATVWEVVRQWAGQVRGCVTSPPYAEQRAQAYGGIPAAAYVAWFLPIADHLRGVLAEDGSFLLNLKEHSEDVRRPVYVHALVVALVEQQGWSYIDEYCWPRIGIPGDPVTRGKFKNQWEPVFWFGKQARPVFHPERVKHRGDRAIIDTDYQPGIARLQGTGRDMMGPDERRGPGWSYPGNRLPTFGEAPALGQPAAFPVGLPQFFVEVNSEVGDWWVDPFGGSGSTLLACEATGRQCVSIDRSPAYTAITLQRCQDAASLVPVRVD